MCSTLETLELNSIRWCLLSCIQFHYSTYILQEFPLFFLQICSSRSPLHCLKKKKTNKKKQICTLAAVDTLLCISFEFPATNCQTDLYLGNSLWQSVHSTIYCFKDKVINFTFWKQQQMTFTHLLKQWLDDYWYVFQSRLQQTTLMHVIKIVKLIQRFEDFSLSPSPLPIPEILQLYC